MIIFSALQLVTFSAHDPDVHPSLYKTVAGVDHMSFPEFLSTYVSTKTVDLLNVDIEGAEMDLFKIFNGKRA